MARSTRKRYGLFNFALDVILTCITGGLWLIWIFCREMRR
ncbi:membrane protein [Gordonia phage Secretariat]|uniref:Membrane protein n=1 Tax=Gordonia phage Secretariat TaxID=2725616 RepID=A0A6M3SWW2_9CAUD|nr:membrane protein [Gordonia phage Secretariat]QJD49650.1 membrane protein [Gordonia phage Secretariat]